MTIEDYIKTFKELLRNMYNEHPDVTTMIFIRNNDDVFMGGANCLRCVLDELVQYCIEEHIKHTDKEHPANLAEEKAEEEIKH